MNAFTHAMDINDRVWRACRILYWSPVFRSWVDKDHMASLPPGESARAAESQFEQESGQRCMLEEWNL